LEKDIIGIRFQNYRIFLDVDSNILLFRAVQQKFHPTLADYRKTGGGFCHITTSLKKGLTFEVKMKCPDTDFSLKHKFMELYPGYEFGIISGDINQRCRGVLKL